MVGKKILVLDENATSRNFLANTLREKQFKVFEAASGKEALILAWRDEPDLVLFDPVLSDIKEREFIQKLRSDSRTSTFPLIALSSDPSSNRKEACLSSGVNEYFIKSSQALSALDESFSRLFVEPQTSDVPGKNPGLLIVFLSAKGGTGTSSLCANLAMNIKQSQPEASVVVADLVLPIGSIGQIVGYDDRPNLVSVADLTAAQTNIAYFRNNLPEPELWQFQLLA
ncbi:MAG TPA: response regulator, partial [Anaerolineales bacterium]|nr:response regulator [Anaerolineales bacterium]